MISPLWITDIDNQLLPARFEHLRADKNFETILPNIELCKLVPMLICGNELIFSEAGLYKARLSDEKTDNILQCWKGGIHILPPRIFLSPDMKLCVGDGRHRINATLILKASRIPILVPLVESILIRAILLH